MVDRVERLTNLLALLLETTEPLSLVQIAGELEGQYPEGQVARRGAFERDKAALREIGVPIEGIIQAGGPYAGQTRYRIDRRAYELADLQLDDDERRALQVAVAAIRTGSDLGQEALWKVGAGIAEPEHPVAVAVPSLPVLPRLREAVATRAVVSFRYRDLDREVEPWALVLREGFWYLVGHDRGRGARRTFRVDRLDAEAEVQVGPRGAFERPVDLDPATAIPSDPKLLGVGEPIEVVVLVDAARARRVEHEVGPERVTERRADGSIVVTVPTANPVAFRSWVLGMLEHAEVLAPPAVRDDVVAWLEAVAR
jgi:predicted DNA-binding transcriptional regulator YafY